VLSSAASSVLRDHDEHVECRVFLWVGVAAFLVVMPFSYMPWEKYALPLLMLQGAALALVIDRTISLQNGGARGC
jgi:lipoprotein signal peptidase